MKKIMSLIIFSLLTSCATGTWDHLSEDNTNLNFDKGYCRFFVNSKAPIYICRNPFYCESDEWSDAITSIAQNTATYDHCMYKRL